MIAHIAPRLNGRDAAGSREATLEAQRLGRSRVLPSDEPIPTEIFPMTKLGLFALASAASLVALPALAQQAPQQVSSPGGGDMTLAQTATQNPPPAPGSGQLWTSTQTVNGANVTIVANPPIPDTAANRKRYGPPMDHRPLTRPEPPVGGGAPAAPATPQQ
jgi:hypothetical protein